MNADFQLVRKMKAGDEEAVDAFVRKYYSTILTYCRYHTWNTEFAEDLTQDVFYNFFKSLSSYRHEGKLLNYLYVIARNLCMSNYKSKLPIANMEEEGLRQRVSEDQADNIEDVPQRLDLEKAIKNLPCELQEVIILYYFQGVKQREIAGICGIGLPLVKYRLKQAKEQLKSLLGEKNEEEHS